MNEILYTNSEMHDITNRLRDFPSCAEFCAFMDKKFKKDIWKALINRKGPHIEGDSLEAQRLIHKTITDYKGPDGACDKWEYSPMHRVTRFLYEIPFEDIPIFVYNHGLDPHKKITLMWRLEVAGK
jgi:hypothetical protein